jgi:oligopeptide/dipeptide ABC transporter ATP-binding protein
MSKPLLSIHNLKTYFFTEDGVVKAVDGISYTVAPGEILGVVGESGCGKSVSVLSVLRLIPEPPGKIVDGEILFDGIDLLKLSEAEMRKVRGNKISMIFQEPMTSLNPVFTVGYQIEEALRLHQKIEKRDALEKTVEMLRLVEIPSPGRRIKEYPHQLSGGMRQRVMIAMALACRPKLLIADEPTTALDVTIQAQILDLMLKLREELNVGIILITHDLAVIAEMARRVVVMYAGTIVEVAGVEAIFFNPLHPYTQGLLRTRPQIEDIKKSGEKVRLQEIRGEVPDLLDLHGGCKFSSRCPAVQAVCKREEPELKELGEGHFVRCWFAGKLGA